jgi:hypothetical protein
MNLISTEIKTTGFIYLGEQDKYGGYHQPATFVNTFIQYPISLNNNSQMLGYNLLVPLPIPLIAGYNPLTIYEEPSEETFVGIYICFDAYYYGNSFIPFDKYTGGIQFVKQAYGGGNPFSSSKPTLRVNGANGNYALYRFEIAARYVSKNKYYRYVENTASAPVAEKPNYLCFANGYYLDNRTIPSNPKIIPTVSGIETIGYYQKNPMEAIPDLTTIEWREYQIECKKDQPIYLPIDNLFLGTLYCSPELKTLISATAVAITEYSWSDAFPDAIPAIFSHWMTLYSPLAAAQNSITPNTTGFSTTLSTKTIQTFELDRVVRRISANNNCWQTTPIAELDNDLNPLPTHPMFFVNAARTYDYHFSPQTKGIGSLTMDSPRLIEIHKALDAGKFSKNELNSNKDRYTTLGYYIEKTASLLGHRLDANGEIDKQREKALTRNILPPTSKPDPKKHGGSSFGHESLLVRRLNNHFNKDKIEDGGVVAVPDLPQLMLEVLDQLNLGLGIQESSAIEIKHDGQTHRYPNLLALVTEIAIHQFNQSQYSKSTHISSLVTQQQTNEIIGGLGLPTISKQIMRTVNGKNAAIPYWGIAPQASIAKKIDTCTYNVGLVLGQVT